MRRAPIFWHAGGWRANLLAPASAGFQLGGWFRRFTTTPARMPRPVICVGNLVAGGAGKTPTVLKLVEMLRAAGRQPHILLRGYGGSLKGPLAVDPACHDYRQVGDEALLLAGVAPTWVAADRAAGAHAAIAAGAELIIMDDGLQNPGIAPSQAMLVVDGGYGFGNGRVIPAGPLRESVAAGLSKVQLALVVGEDKAGIAQRLGDRVPLVHGDIVAVDPDLWAGRRVLAFAGIGRPEKFFATLEHLGAVIVARHGFPDHYPYDAGEIDALLVAASVSGATLVTTAKDHVRLPPHQRDQVQILPVGLVWRGSEDEAKVRAWLGALL